MDIINSDVFKTVDKLNGDAAILSENPLSIVDQWVDTGSYALNAIISGSLYGGIPMGRITGLAGPSQCGKTLMMNNIFANAQKAGMVPVIWDTEAAEDPVSAAGCGCDPTNMKYYPVETVEECRNQIVTFLDNVIKKPELRGKFIIGIDSLGNLASTKEIADALAGKSAVDMGLRAKSLKSMMRTLTYRAAKANIPIVFSNHIYDDPSSLFPSLVKNQSGGKGSVYLSSILVQMSTKSDKIVDNKDEDSIAIAHKVSGTHITAMTVKNRFLPPYLKTDLHVNFKSGLSKYAGLLDIATGYGVIAQNGATYALADGTKLGYFKNWGSDTKLWEEKILPDLEEVINKEFKYGGGTVADEFVDQLSALGSADDAEDEDA
jgi:recombination protein RecA